MQGREEHPGAPHAPHHPGQLPLGFWWPIATARPSPWRAAPGEQRQDTPALRRGSPGSAGGLGGAARGRRAGQQEPPLASPRGGEKKEAFTEVSPAATRYLKGALPAEAGSHGNVSSAVSPREQTAEGVALLYLLKCSSSSPSPCSPFPIST